MSKEKKLNKNRLKAWLHVMWTDCHSVRMEHENKEESNIDDAYKQIYQLIEQKPIDEAKLEKFAEKWANDFAVTTLHDKGMKERIKQMLSDYNKLREG